MHRATRRAGVLQHEPRVFAEAHPSVADLVAVAHEADDTTRFCRLSILAEHAAHWIGGIVSAIAAWIEARPRPRVLLGDGVRNGISGVVASAAGVVWAQGGAPHLFGTEAPRDGS